MRFRRDEDGNSMVISATVALSLFALTFGALTLYLSGAVQDASEKTGDDLDDRAHSALDILVSSPGYPADWHLRDDANVTHLGLLKRGTASTLDGDKFRELRTDRSTYAWYNDVMKSLLDLGGYDFHLRTYPLLATDSDGNVPALATYRVAYVGNLSHGGWTTDAAALALTNVDHDPVLSTVLGSGLRGGDAFVTTSSRDLAAQLLPRLAGFQQGTDQNGGYTYDGYWKIVNLTDAPTSRIPAGTATRILTPNTRDGLNDWKAAGSAAGTTDRLVVAELDLTGHAGATGAWFNLTQHYEQQGLLTNGKVRVYCWTCGTPGWTTLATLNSNIGGTTPADFWAASSYDLKAYAGKRVHVALEFTSSNPGTTLTAWFVKELRAEVRHGGATTTYYANTLDYTTSEYDALVIGEDVNQALLVDADQSHLVRRALQDWARAGGDLVAFGSDTVTADWLSPTLMPSGAALATTGLLSAGSDLTHAVLTTPHALDYANYGLDYPLTYPIDDDAPYTSVLLGEGGGAPTIFAVSNPNQAFNGSIALTSWTLGDMPAEDRHPFLVNVFTYGRYSVLYLDYGAQLPGRADVASQTRTVVVDTNDADLEHVETQITMYVWA